jgi:acyl carrier protein
VEAINKLESFIRDEIMRGKRDTSINPDESLIQSGLLDSLALLQLVGFIEEEFDVTVEDEEVVPDNFDSLTAINAFISRKS